MAVRLLDTLERAMGLRRQLDADWIPAPDLASHQNDSHDASLADKIALLIAPKHCLQESLLKIIQLLARIAESGHLNYRPTTEVQTCARWQPEQVNAARGYVFAHVPCPNIKAGRVEFVMQLGVNKMHLPQVWLIWVADDAREVLNRLARMSVACNTLGFDQQDTVQIGLAKRVSGTATDCGDYSIQRCLHVRYSSEVRRVAFHSPFQSRVTSTCQG